MSDKERPLFNAKSLYPIFGFTALIISLIVLIILYKTEIFRSYMWIISITVGFVSEVILYLKIKYNILIFDDRVVKKRIWFNDEVLKYELISEVTYIRPVAPNSGAGALIFKPKSGKNIQCRFAYGYEKELVSIVDFLHKKNNTVTTRP